MIWSIFNRKKEPHILINDLSSIDQTVQKEAYHALLDYPNQDAEELMIMSLDSSDVEKNKKLALISILAHRGCEEVVPSLKRLFKAEDTELKNAVVNALFEIGTSECIDILIQFLSNSDDVIKQNILSLISKLPENDSLGALIRCIPDNKNDPLYFDIVSLMEELDFFEILKRNFDQPNPMVKKFYFDNLIKFDRPDFIPLYLSYYKNAENIHKDIILGIFKSSNISDLIKYFSEYLKNNSDDNSLLIDKAIISRYNEANIEILKFVVSLKNTQYKAKVLPTLLKYTDPYTFYIIFELLKEDSRELRELACNSLINLLNKTYQRIDDFKEPNINSLKDFIINWKDLIKEKMLDRHNLTEDYYKLIRKIFFEFCNHDHEFLQDIFVDLLKNDFFETYYQLKNWNFEDKFNVYSLVIKKEPAIGSIILSSLTARADETLWRLAVKLSNAFEDEDDSEVFQKNLVSRYRNISFEKFLRDNDSGVRAAAIGICSKSKQPGYLDIVKNYLKDPSPEVRKSAIKCLLNDHATNINSVITESLHDPDDAVTLYVLKEIKKRKINIDVSVFLVNFLNSKTKELREFAQQEISIITKERYKTNFNSMTPEMRKLAAQAIIKIDNNFTDEVINDLSSFDPQTRLKAALLLENIQLNDKGQNALISAMKDPSQKVRAAVVKTLGIIGNEKIIKHLIECFNDSDTRVRANTVEAIASLGNADVVRILLPYLEDSNNRIRANAIVGICKFGRYNVSAILQKMLTDADINMRASALWAIGEIGESYYLQLAFQFVQDANELIRYNSIKAISRINPQLLVPYLPLLRKDNSQKIKNIVKEISHIII